MDGGGRDEGEMWLSNERMKTSSSITRSDVVGQG